MSRTLSPVTHDTLDALIIKVLADIANMRESMAEDDLRQAELRRLADEMNRAAERREWESKL